MKRSTNNGKGSATHMASTEATATHTIHTDPAASAANTGSAAADAPETTAAMALHLAVTDVVFEAIKPAPPAAAAAKKPAGKRGPKSKARPELSIDLLMKAAHIRSIKELAARAGVSRPTVYNWRNKGLTYWKADELAIKLAGLHPASVFGPVWFGLDEDQVAVAA